MIDVILVSVVLLMMLLIFLIVYGIVLGFILYIVVKLVCGKKDEISISVWVLIVLFIVKFVFLF